MAFLLHFLTFVLVKAVTGDGIITSPGYPQLYPPNVTKTYPIWAANSSVDTVSVSMKFSFFQTQQCLSCQCDRVEILVGGKITHAYCGYILPNSDGLVLIRNSTQPISVRFISNSDSEVKSGFFANYSISVVHEVHTSTIKPTKPPSCLPVLCPTCPSGDTPHYRYFTDRCPAYCECESSSVAQQSPPNGTVSRDYPMDNNETYLNQGYIRTPGLANYPHRYPLFYDTHVRIDMGIDHIYKDKSVKFTFLHFDVDHCKYTYDGKTCRCDYITFNNFRGLEETRLCDRNNITMNRTYHFRPASRSDRYLEFTFHSDGFLVLTGYVIKFEVEEGAVPTCTDIQNKTCTNHCPMGYWRDFAGCSTCQCITTTPATTTVTTTTPAPTTPKLTTTTSAPTTHMLFKSKLLDRLMGLIGQMKDLYNDIRDSRVLDYA